MGKADWKYVVVTLLLTAVALWLGSLTLAYLSGIVLGYRMGVKREFSGMLGHRKIV